MGKRQHHLRVVHTHRRVNDLDGLHGRADGGAGFASACDCTGLRGRLEQLSQDLLRVDAATAGLERARRRQARRWQQACAATTELAFETARQTGSGGGGGGSGGSAMDAHAKQLRRALFGKPAAFTYAHAWPAEGAPSCRHRTTTGTVCRGVGRW